MKDIALVIFMEDTTMKKAMVLMGIAYTGVCLGMSIWMVARPEAYGRWVSRMLNGMTSIFEKEEI